MNLAIVVVFVFVSMFAAFVVAIDPGNNPASWHIISTSACYQSDNPITYPEPDNDSDSDNELIKNDGCCKCEVRSFLQPGYLCLYEAGMIEK